MIGGALPKPAGRRRSRRRSLCSSGAQLRPRRARTWDGNKKNAPQVTGRRSNYAHLTDHNVQLRHHSSVKNPEQKNSPEIKISGPTTMLSSLNCLYRNQLTSTAPETTVTGESRITQVFRHRDICIRIPTQSATTSLTFGTLSSNGPWCIMISEQRGEHRER